MKSLNQKIMQLEGLIDTRDVTQWENAFLQNVVALTDGGKDTTRLTDGQIESAERIYAKHFA